MKNKILISGGWGYGNIGDDAILLATVRLLRDKFPETELIITSYCPEETRSLFIDSNDIEVIPSMHRILFGDSAFKFLNTYGKSFNSHALPSLLRRCYNKAHRMFSTSEDSCHELERGLKSVEYKEYTERLSDCDMFLMSGGGYFNNWNESFISRIEEIKAAKDYNIPAHIFGQTLDAFTPERTVLVEEWFKTLLSVTVRDTDSLNFLKSIGINADIAPDMVLSLPKDKAVIPDKVIFIPAELLTPNKHIILDDIAALAAEGKKVTLTLTRRYNGDVVDAKACYKYLRRKSSNVTLEIPEDIHQLETILSGNELTISRNLHGLILGAVHGAQTLISLHNGWKFVSFMQQIGLSGNIIDIYNIKPGNIVALTNNKIPQGALESLRKLVTTAFNQTIE